MHPAIRERASRERVLVQTLPIQLVRARDVVMQRFRPHLNARGLTDPQWRVLRALMESDAMEVGELAGRCCIHPASLSRILPRLEEQGLAQRSVRAEDKRRLTVTITSHGRKLVQTVVPDSEAVYGEIMRKLGPKRLAEMHRLLDEMITALDERRPAGRR